MGDTETSQLTATRAKLRVDKLVVTECSQEVTMHAVCGTKRDANGIDEDNTYSKATPSGQVTLSITNPALNGFFVPGKYYYADITPAPTTGQE